jgi:uncharacterized membrane protein YagU involved in acid resistance
MVEGSDAADLQASGYVYRTSLRARFAAGIAAGIVGGILMMGFMMTYARVGGMGVTMPLKALAAQVYGVEALVSGPKAMLDGALIQLGFSIVLGVLFALFISRRTSMIAALFAGIAVGIAIWVAMDLYVLPFTNPTMAARVALMPSAYFIAHLLYGVGLAMTPAFIRTFSKERLNPGSERVAETQPNRKHRLLLWIGGIFAALIVALFIASFFLDDMIRTRTEAAMNQTLTGYHVALDRAHLQLLSGLLTLKGLKIIQQAHPYPAVADVPMMRFHIEWKELLSRRVVADVLLSHPKVHVNRTQLVSEKNSRVPMKQEGWQDALEAAYPFKVNRFTIDEGDVVYIQDAVNPPLHLAKLNFTTDNIRNIHAPNNVYPSKVHANLVIFGTGRATIDGHANYLEEPFPGARTQFTIENVPLSSFDPEIRQINIAVSGGRLFGSGLVEYSPKVTRVQVDNATIEGVAVGYVHAPATQQAEARRVKATGKQIEKQNNRPAVDIEVRKFDVTHSSFSYTDKTKDPNYRLFFNDTDIALKNLSNHQQQGSAVLTFHGKFMGSGDTRVSGNFLASKHGPAFNMSVAIQNTDLPSMNDILRAYGRFDVAAGQFSVFSEVSIKDGYINGYVKPMFSNLEVYKYEKDKNTGVLHQARELVIGGATHLFKNFSTQQVATEVDLTGKLTSPGVSTWQGFVQVLHNAFIEAILPGFDRSIRPNLAPDTSRQAHRTRSSLIPPST